MGAKPIKLADILDATAEAMRVELSRLRAGLVHPGLRGSSAEEVVRDMLKLHLPSSLGVTVGEVVDANGNVSGQADVIIYDTLRTPMLFSSAKDSIHAVPAEGVVGVVEVKSRLQKKDIPQIVDHARRLAHLEKSAYFPMPIVHSYSFYGRSVATFPSIYSVFAFESDGVYTEELNEAQADVPLEERVANIVCLDRGFLLNGAVRDVFSGENPVHMSATPEPDSRMVHTSEADALVVWFAMNSTLWAQANIPPLNISVYLKERLSVIRTTVAPADGRAFLASTQDEMAREFGISISLARKMGTPAQDDLEPEELLELIEVYGRTGRFGPADPTIKRLWQTVFAMPAEYRLAAVKSLMPGRQGPRS